MVFLPIEFPPAASGVQLQIIALVMAQFQKIFDERLSSLSRTMRETRDIYELGCGLGHAISNFEGEHVLVQESYTCAWFSISS